MLIIKMSNPESNQKEEDADQCDHAIEDALEQMHKMKASKEKSLNHAITSADDFGVPPTSEGVKLDNLRNSLGMELSNSKHEKLRKIMNRGKKC